MAHYVDNEEFYKAMVEYKQALREAEEADDPKPQVSNYIGDCIIKISVHLATMPKFSNYPFKEEMINDGIENCIRYIDNFNEAKYKNPFAYFTKISYWAFIRRIKKEKSHLYTKLKASETATIMSLTSDVQTHDVGNNYDDGVKRGEWSEEFVQNFIRDFEESKSKNKKK